MSADLRETLARSDEQTRQATSDRLKGCPRTVKASELRLADIVACESIAGYGTATVKQIKDGYVTLFRPYVETADFSYTGGVICYIGIEEWKVPAGDIEWRVLRRKDLL